MATQEPPVPLEVVEAAYTALAARDLVRSSGASFDIPECHIWTVAQGRVSEVAFFIDTAAMLSALTDA